MIQYQFFPRSQGITPEIRKVIDCFTQVSDKIDSDTKNLKSNEVLQHLYQPLSEIGYAVETSKAKDDKIDVPVLFGLDNRIDKSYNADALSQDGKIVIEVEAGRATENNQYMKDIFQACMMFEVEYLVVAVRNTYRGHKDFEIVFTFLETLYISSRLHLPLKGILLVGY
ncbi:hypothetical protein CYPRO_0583 [Cyclonatronum proteinivorum]|uniref:Uncharacterized protein n=1 Tax=Cyclonatronum proteinivorum TaxID=1457365 RepID=A0A345UHB6_9BACT|nr:hypothetical protein [Cyclonatronum proteinivorum]AXI99867.1 hypothetical protein CYPRO_0583 [Cyclonatronum proteinivorum]